jgi:hypothetical protein
MHAAGGAQAANVHPVIREIQVSGITGVAHALTAVVAAAPPIKKFPIRETGRTQP